MLGEPLPNSLTIKIHRLLIEVDKVPNKMKLLAWYSRDLSTGNHQALLKALTHNSQLAMLIKIGKLISKDPSKFFIIMQMLQIYKTEINTTIQKVPWKTLQLSQSILASVKLVSIMIDNIVLMSQGKMINDSK